MAEMDRQRGERVKNLRDDRSWTQRKLAEKLDVDVKSIRNWESGKEMNPGNLEDLAKLFEVTPEYIRYGEREAPDLTGLLNAGGQSQLDRIESTLRDLRADLATTRDEVAALETSLTRQLRSLARKLDTGDSGSQSQPGG